MGSSRMVQSSAISADNPTSKPGLPYLKQKPGVRGSQNLRGGLHMKTLTKKKVIPQTLTRPMTMTEAKWKPWTGKSLR